MRKTTEIALKNFSLQAGGDGNIEHGKKILFQIHNTAWMNAQAALRQVAVNEKQLAYMMKPLLKGVTMPPFLNTPTDLSVGEFATLMSGVQALTQAQGRTGGIGAMGDLADDAWRRVQTIRDDVTKKHTKDGTTSFEKVNEELNTLYNDPNSDYRMAVDVTSQYFYALNPMFDASGEVVPWKDLPRAMQKVPYEGGIFSRVGDVWRRIFQGEKVPWNQTQAVPPSLGPGRDVVPEQSAGGYTPSATAQEMLK